jgi:hypothetical protein
MIFSILFILFSLITIDKIKPLNELLFYKQFILFSILYLIILPVILIFLGNIYFYLTNKKEWFYWLKIPEYYDDIFTIVAIFPIFIFTIFEVILFCAYYTKIFELNSWLCLLLFSIIGGIIFSLAQIIVRKIYRIRL